MGIEDQAQLAQQTQQAQLAQQARVFVERFLQISGVQSNGAPSQRTDPGFVPFFYREESAVIHAGQRYQGIEKIRERIEASPSDARIIPASIDIDFDLSGQTIFALASGHILLSGEEHPFPFTQWFRLALKPGESLPPMEQLQANVIPNFYILQEMSQIVLH